MGRRLNLKQQKITRQRYGWKMSRVRTKEEKLRQHEKPQRKARWGVQEGLPFPDIYIIYPKEFPLNKANITCVSWQFWDLDTPLYQYNFNIRVYDKGCIFLSLSSISLFFRILTFLWPYQSHLNLLNRWTFFIRICYDLSTIVHSLRQMYIAKTIDIMLVQ